MKENTSSSNKIFKPLMPSNKMPFMIGGVVFIIFVGLVVGFFVSKKKASLSNSSSSDVTVSATEAGVKDISSIKDIKVDDATGTLQQGGKNGVGTYHLDREGGATHTVYLNSTTIDMSSFVGKKVQVWGQTQAAGGVSWLMDVLKIKVVQ